MHELPSTGFLRLTQIIGSSKTKSHILPLIPVSKSTWWAGVRSGRYPKAYHLGPKITVWRIEDIQQLIAETQP